MKKPTILNKDADLPQSTQNGQCEFRSVNLGKQRRVPCQSRSWAEIARLARKSGSILSPLILRFFVSVEHSVPSWLPGYSPSGGVRRDRILQIIAATKCETRKQLEHDKACSSIRTAVLTKLKDAGRRLVRIGDRDFAKPNPRHRFHQRIGRAKTSLDLSVQAHLIILVSDRVLVL